MKLKRILLILIFIPVYMNIYARATPEEEYKKIQKQLASGWNTWDTRSVLTHVLLPYGAAIDLNLTDNDGKRINTFRIGGNPLMHPRHHAYDGSYTDVSLEWNGHRLRVQSASDGLNNIILISPLEGNRKNGQLIVIPKSLWQRANKITIQGNRFSIAPYGFDINIPVIIQGTYIRTDEKEIKMSVDEPVAICCGQDMTVGEAQKYIEQRANMFVEKNKERYKDKYESYNAMQSVLAWDNIYDPSIKKVITPVSRNWNVNWSHHPEFGGFVLFCWDTYFAGMMLALDNKDLAYANVAEITNSITEAGFVPNFYTGNDLKSRDRSQPPVGSLAVWSIYKKYKEKWFLELLYDKLLTWNRWWDKNRNINGLLCWGSNPYEKVTYHARESGGINELYCAGLESGLDNSPMYDNIKYDKARHMMLLNDVGLSSLYIMDCDYLANIAEELNRSEDAKGLRAKGKSYRKMLQSLWDNENGLYYNKHTDTGLLNGRISPTNFYPLLASVPDQKQAERMINEHLLNPDEFWGEYVIPATPKNDPAFKDNIYWRGRIWAPLNFLVYLGLRNYDFVDVRKSLAEKSEKLLMKSWISNGYVFENYNATTGQGDDTQRSDKFYHWGALLGFIGLIEDGYFMNE
ncbi:MGH1-like glycoside hydrolase domain-containing protein [Dysgonomonas termitidis]|uniref:Trehalase family glycosidase n=1 Tax=Dysgonomonas termitidis TaxID=1516126 RepID=A0ABV9KQZ6_9BACT